MDVGRSACHSAGRLELSPRALRRHENRCRRRRPARSAGSRRNDWPISTGDPCGVQHYWMKQIHQGIDDVRRFAQETDYEILRLFGDRFVPIGELHTDRDEEVPNYLLIPQERVAELTPLLCREQPTA